jgi:predicted transcriptional regulator
MLVKAVLSGTTEKKSLQEMLNIKDWQLNAHIRDLTDLGYVKKEESQVKLQETTKAILLRDLAKKFDISKLLHESNELVLSCLTEPLTLTQLESQTGLSRTTIYRTISELESIGAIEKDADLFSLNKSDERLLLFAKLLQTEIGQKYQGPNIEIIYNDANVVIKKVAKEQVTEGEITAFSVFTDYGIEYHTTHDYYVIQKSPIDLYDILIHSLIAVIKAKDKLGLVMCMVFYLKHKEKMDMMNIRAKAKEYNVIGIWLDVEAYIRGGKPRNLELFLPWNEFVQKAELYDIPEGSYLLPAAYPSLFEEIGKKLTSPLTIYLLGGENMRIKGLKPRTKDCDIVVENKEDFERFSKVLKDMSYEPKVKIEFVEEDMRIFPDEILLHPNRSRIDLFTNRILKDLSLSKKMIDTAAYADFGNLRLGILRNEYVFLLKAVAGREGDIQDMEALVRAPTKTQTMYQQDTFDWNLVWQEILMQEHMNHLRNFTTVIFEQIDMFSQQTKIIPPFYDNLRRHTVSLLILQILHGGKKPLKEIVSLLKGHDVTEQMIRNRIDSLVTDKKVTKQNIGNQVFVSPIKLEAFPEGTRQITQSNVSLYLEWRFFTREPSDSETIKKFCDELNSFGYTTIGDLDQMILRALDVFIEYEKQHFANQPFRQVGAARICLRLADDQIGEMNGYRISEFEKYKSMLVSKFIHEQNNGERKAN